MPNTQAIINEIQTLINALGIYKTVEIGAVKNWTNADPVCEIMLAEDDSEHYAMGQKIRDAQGYRITSGVNYTANGVTPASAVATLITIRDTVVPMFQQRTILAGVSGVQDSRVKPGSAKIWFWHDKAGNSYIVHEFVVEVKQLYNVPMGASYQ